MLVFLVHKNKEVLRVSLELKVRGDNQVALDYQEQMDNQVRVDNRVSWVPQVLLDSLASLEHQELQVIQDLLDSQVLMDSLTTGTVWFPGLYRHSLRTIYDALYKSTHHHHHHHHHRQHELRYVRLYLQCE